MALIAKRSSSSDSSDDKPNKSTKPKLSLMKEPYKPSSRIQDYSFLLYGAKKGGKTSTAARFPNAYFLALEPGTKGISGVRFSNVTNWDEFVGYVDLLEAENDKDMTTIVDTVDLAYEFLFTHICRSLKIEHPNEERDHGATWKKISAAFREQIMRIINFPGGKIFISHDTEKEIELRDGKTVDRVQPTMAKQAMAVVEGIVDVIMNYAYRDDERVIYMDGSQTLVAGNRLEQNFIRKGGKPDTPGDKIVAIPMGRTASEGYANIVKAFNNQQETVDGLLSQETQAPSKLIKSSEKKSGGLFIKKTK